MDFNSNGGWLSKTIYSVKQGIKVYYSGYIDFIEQSQDREWNRYLNGKNFSLRIGLKGLIRSILKLLMEKSGEKAVQLVKPELNVTNKAQ